MIRFGTAARRPSWFTAFTKRACRSGVQTRRGRLTARVTGASLSSAATRYSARLEHLHQRQSQKLHKAARKKRLASRRWAQTCRRMLLAVCRLAPPVAVRQAVACAKRGLGGPAYTHSLRCCTGPEQQLRS